MNNNPSIMTDEQYDFCKNQANKLAKILMDENVENIFGKNGNAIFVLETLVILTAGTLSLLSKQINVDALSILRAFCGHVEYTLKANEKKPFLKLVH